MITGERSVKELVQPQALRGRDEGASGSWAASAHFMVWPCGSSCSSGASKTYLSSYNGTTRRPVRSPGAK